MKSVPPKVDILGVAVSTTSYDQVTALCSRWMSEKRAGKSAARGLYICATSVHGVMEARKHPEIRAILNHADIVSPDGMPLVWALRSFGVKNQQRVYGPELMLRLCAAAEKRGHRVFLYGARSETLEVLTLKLRRRFPGLVIAGSFSPPFRPLSEPEDEGICRAIDDADPDLILVGISTPRQEAWMAAHSNRFPGVVMAGVGAAFDFHAGRVPQAPKWMQSRGLEWLYRFSREPVRLWKRYVLITPPFLPLWGIQKLSLVMRDFACSPPSTASREFALSKNLMGGNTHAGQ